MKKNPSIKRKGYSIVVDENMPGIDHLFDDLADVIRVEGRRIDHSILKGADALLCRSITQVTKALLQNTSVKFVGSATIGIDHLDIAWLDSQGISWANAAGCNAAAVAQYVLSAVAFWCQSNQKTIEDLTIGIVGAGNVGTELARCLDQLSIKYLLFDPPLERAEDHRKFVSMNDIMECDVISLHVPMETTGDDPTYHLMGLKELNLLSEHQLLINASRGAVVDNRALEIYLSNKNSANVILDVFESEPNIPRRLLEHCLLATPHIAGHTLEGKLRGSWIIYQNFCQYFDINAEKTEDSLYPSPNQIKLISDDLIANLLAIYDVCSDSNALTINDDEPISTKFDRLRKNATQLANGKTRRDYSGWHYVGGYQLPL